jgi:hypothetical protein
MSVAVERDRDRRVPQIGRSTPASIMVEANVCRHAWSSIGTSASGSGTPSVPNLRRRAFSLAHAFAARSPTVEGLNGRSVSRPNTSPSRRPERNRWASRDSRSTFALGTRLRPRAALGAYLANNVIPPALHADYVGIEVDVIPAHAHHRAMTCTLKGGPSALGQSSLRSHRRAALRTSWRLGERCWGR